MPLDPPPPRLPIGDSDLVKLREPGVIDELQACGASPVREVAVVLDGERVRAGVA